VYLAVQLSLLETYGAVWDEPLHRGWALDFTEGGNAGNAWLAGFTSAIGGGIAVPALAPAGTGAGTGGQVTINNITNNTKSISVSVNASTAEASRAGVTGIYSLVMY
jgi:hypothetical protein